ncbi:MAG: CGNR zinc finger domain-containing protein [Neorhizobium sp.]|nr:CGNR zinc finger domain-containing protein [Neorhizobium sp.]
MTFAWTPHRFAGGALALDVANSVILRFDASRSVDRFADRPQMDAFAVAAASFCAERALFGTLEPVSAGDRAGFLALREAVDGYFRHRLLCDADDEVLRTRLADLLETAAAMLRVGGKASLAAETAHSALRLLYSDTLARIRICGHCGWLFVDRSKNRSRMWCDMAVCGNRVKASRHYRQGRAARSAHPPTTE